MGCDRESESPTRSEFGGDGKPSSHPLTDVYRQPDSWQGLVPKKKDRDGDR
jgi:hypothetical protein